MALTRRVPNIARQVSYRSLADPATDTELEQAYRDDAVHDTHRDDPAFDDRHLHAEAAQAGQPTAARTAWRICSDNGWGRLLQEAAQERGATGPTGAR